MTELLAPAGDFERLYFAFLYGADAVYFGGQNFGLRANAKNFNLEEMKKATEYAHSLGKKVYVTVNIVFHDSDFAGLDEYLKYLDEINVDSIIVSDIAVIKRVKELGLNLAMCLSTQASTMNSRAVKFWRNLGVTRVVLAREASRDAIKRIKDTGIEVEAFIHGAMCTSFSGKCVLSNYMTLRDANRGGCAQVCRWNFARIDGEENLTITPKDLNMVKFLEDEINMGIDSFKIEGRMRSIYYVATVIWCYRRMIDGIINKTLTEPDKAYYLAILNRCANRESAPQFFDKLPGVDEQYFNGRDEISNQDFLGLVLDYDDDAKIATIDTRNYFEVGTEVEFFGPNTETFSIVLNKIYNDSDESIDASRHPKTIVKIPVDKKLAKNDFMRLKVIDKSSIL
ncbi:MAG TPA: U32 family peptidase [Candidatus Onthocola stercorigallinarum]|nr:U32 family peptidase [Candidatus Onthocola stercorigallinarum]